MIEFLLSPFSFILAFLLYIASDFFDRRPWKKGLKICSIIVLAVTIITWIDSFNAKLTDSAIGHHALLVGTVTHHVEELLDHQKYQEADSFIKEFNNYYYETFYSSDELEKFLKRKKLKIYSRDIEEIKKKLDDLENKVRSEP